MSTTEVPQGNPGATKSPMTVYIRSIITKRIKAAITRIDTTKRLNEEIETLKSDTSIASDVRATKNENYQKLAGDLYGNLALMVEIINVKVGEWKEMIEAIEDNHRKFVEKTFRELYFEKTLCEYIDRREEKDGELEDENMLTLFLLDCDQTLNDLKLIIECRSEYTSAPASTAQSVAEESQIGANSTEQNPPSQNPIIPSTPTAQSAEMSTPLNSDFSPRPESQPAVISRSAVIHKEAEREGHLEVVRAKCGNVNSPQDEGEGLEKGEKGHHPLSTHSLSHPSHPIHPVHHRCSLYECNCKMSTTSGRGEGGRREEEMRKGIGVTEDKRGNERWMPEIQRDDMIIHEGAAKGQGTFEAIFRDQEHPTIPMDLYSYPYPQGTSMGPDYSHPMLVMTTAQLPNLPPPSLDGKEPLPFPSSLETFEAMVISQFGLTDLSKLFYLRSCLRGEALDFISSIVGRGPCYAAATEILRAIYNTESHQMATELRLLIKQVRKPGEDYGAKEKLKGIRELLILTSLLLIHAAEFLHLLLTNTIVTKLPDRTMNSDRVTEDTEKRESKTKAVMPNQFRILDADPAHATIEKDLTENEEPSHLIENQTAQMGAGQTVRGSRKPGSDDLPPNHSVTLHELSRSLSNSAVTTMTYSPVPLEKGEVGGTIPPHLQNEVSSDFGVLDDPIIDQDPLYLSTSEILEATDYDDVLALLATRIRRENERKEARSFLLPQKRGFIRREGPYSSEEMQFAETLLIRQHQSRSQREWHTTLTQQGVMKDPNGIWRVENDKIRTLVDESHTAKSPILLFPTDPLSHKIAMRYHREGKHGGVHDTLSNLKQHFWLMRGFTTVTRILKECEHCQDQRNGNPDPKYQSNRKKGRVSPILLSLCLVASFLLPFGNASEIMQSITCLPHGVMINSTRGYGMQVCSKVECQTIPPESNPGSVSVNFPPSISIGPFEVFVKMVSEDSTFSTRQTCPASDVCENMRGDWSWDHLIVPHCYPRMALMIVGIIVYIIATFLALIGYMVCFRQVTGAEVMYSLWRCHCISLRGLGRLFGLFVLLIGAPFRWLLRPARAQGDGRRRGRERLERIRRQTRTILGLATLSLLISFPNVSGCQHAVIFTEEVERCQNGKDCVTEKAMEITIDSITHTGCIQLMNERDGRIEGAISIEVLSNDMTCLRRIMGIHRDAEIHVASSKRCFSMGSCNGERCEGLQKDDAIEEFDHISMFPGHTFCVESGGGWENACLSFHTACLFYRTYLVPTSQKIYESLKCSTWENQVTLRVNSSMGTETTSVNLTLREGEFTSQPDMKGIKLLRIEEIEKEQYVDLLSETFLTDGKRMTIAREFQANNVCLNTENARDFKCTAKERCSCQPATIKAKCECDDSTLAKRFTLEDSLPIKMPSMDIEMNEENGAPIVRRHKGEVKVYLVLSEEIQKTRVREDDYECVVDAGDARGYYKYETGAEVEFRCKAESTSEAILSCNGNALSIPCGTPAVKSTRRMHFETSEVNAKCQVSCSKKEISISGKLFTPPHLAPSHIMNRVKGGEVPRGEFLPDFTPLIEIVIEYWKSATCVIVTTGVAIAITLIAACGVPTSVSWLFSRRRSFSKKKEYKTI